VLALRGHLLALPGHPDQFVRLAHQSVGPATAGGTSPGWISVRPHADLTSRH
jgi:hypothetical protein